MERPNLKFQEEYSAKLPALALLTHLGWSFLSPQQALAARDHQYNHVVLSRLLRAELQKRTFVFAGKRHSLSERNIDHLIAQVANPVLNEGLAKANETLYNHLLYGISVTQLVNGKKANPTIALIDWQNPANNSFVFTEEFTVSRASNGGSGAKNSRRPDIVCFVNGIPWVVIEAKRPDGYSKKGNQKAPTIDEGISQQLRNQRPDEIPQLFAYSQLLLSINGSDGRYGTCGTDLTFWATWKEQDISDAEMYAIKNKRLSAEQLSCLFDHRSASDLTWYQQLIAGGELAVSGQDQLIISLLSPTRLLEITRYYTLFDRKVGKIIARYQQVFSIKRLIERIEMRNTNGGREGGVIWHTTGSGKSFTMVFLSKALLLHDELKQCRFVIVTDRVDLETQLSKTFASGGELSGKKDLNKAKANSSKRLAEQIGKGNERIIFSLIQKFTNATKLPECVNTSADMIVLIDEGHRSQGGENHIRMKQALPNAAFIAFTGTPLLKDDQTTTKFGPIIHAYTMQRAVEDKTVTPLLYEERVPDLDVNERAIDRWFDRITEGLSKAQQSDLKRKYSQKGQVYGTDDRIRLIALDIANHFTQNIDDGLKGQLACDSKASAIKYKQYLDEANLFESAVVMSAPDTREGNTAVDEASASEIARWWKQHVETDFGSNDEQAYTKHVVERFEKDDNLKLLIVVDKLLTGFDEPKNTVLYIDKPLKQHNLIQAIARVNRLHSKKEFGYLIDYRGILSELDTTIKKYQDLASRTQGGYDIDDIAGLYQPMSTEYKRLPQLYKQLWAVFSGVKNRQDIEQMKAPLLPKLKEIDTQFVDVHLKTREDFYEALTQFSSCLKVALQSATFFSDDSFSDNDRRHYKDTVKQFSKLRAIVQRECEETVDYEKYADKVKKLLDKHVVGVEIKESRGVYEVGKMGQAEIVENWSEEKTRNETDIIKTRVTRTIEQELQDDPYAQEAFSTLLRNAIEQAEQLFDHPLKQYLLFYEFEQQVHHRHLDDIPTAAFTGNFSAQAYFGILKIVLPEALSVQDQQVQDKWIALAFDIDNVVSTAVAENSINPDNIEADIRKKLLPRLLNECKSVGGSLQQAKKVVEMVVQNTRIDLNGV